MTHESTNFREPDAKNGEINPQEFGLPPGRSHLKGPPPRPVDFEQIRQLHAGQLPRELELEVRDLTIAFQDWAVASRDVLLERANREIDNGIRSDN